MHRKFPKKKKKKKKGKCRLGFRLDAAQRAVYAGGIRWLGRTKYPPQKSGRIAAGSDVRNTIIVNENVRQLELLSCDPADARRSQVSGPASVRWLPMDAQGRRPGPCYR
ncbi:unnamed protein product [Chrysodeixis includens]|uniref:Uncharacterized protein n=1 Tax=Chrysodeixis includens TaxID=689277 RepID=A0A9P0E200_CHRIL|nr:unnamed protein product [Chrysodeixis includens]